jgi:CheY-like chemotaxis protein
MPVSEQLHPGSNLSERLLPVLGQIRATTDRAEQFGIVRAWFNQHEGDLANDISDLTFLCTLPREERTLLTYPVIGNWVLGRMESFTPQTNHQRTGFAMLRELVVEGRFVNDHWRLEPKEKFNKQVDEFNSFLLKDPDDSMTLNEMMRRISMEMGDAIMSGTLPTSDNYTSDLGHGLSAPVHHFYFLTSLYLPYLVEGHRTEPLDYSIMVVDDQHPDEWYQRMIAVGFRDVKGQQGYFPDCESALEALRAGHYDVILTDLDLGEGKMSGIEFVEQAYSVQKSRGIIPRISFFSYDDTLLRAAEEQLHHWGAGEQKVFQQVNYNNKAFFTAIGFRSDIGRLLADEARLGPNV